MAVTAVAAHCRALPGLDERQLISVTVHFKAFTSKLPVIYLRGMVAATESVLAAALMAPFCQSCRKLHVMRICLRMVAATGFGYSRSG